MFLPEEGFFGVFFLDNLISKATPLEKNNGHNMRSLRLELGLLGLFKRNNANLRGLS